MQKFCTLEEGKVMSYLEKALEVAATFSNRQAAVCLQAATPAQCYTHVSNLPGAGMAWHHECAADLRTSRQPHIGYRQPARAKMHVLSPEVQHQVLCLHAAGPVHQELCRHMHCQAILQRQVAAMSWVT